MPNSDIIRYARSRLSTPAFLAVCGICAALIWVFKGEASSGRAMQVLAPYLLALAGLRLWDDLADLALDRDRHPTRVLCRTQHLRLFRLLAAAGIALPLVLAWQAPHATLGYLLYCIALALTYRLTQSSTGAGAGPSPHRRLRVAVVLLKYPVVCLSSLLVLRPVAPGVVVIQALVLLYATVVAHEIASDRSARLE